MAIDRFTGEYHFLSNMAPLDNKVATPYGVEVATAEQLYSAARFQRESARLVILESDTGYHAKKLVGSLEASGSPTLENWDQLRLPTMRDCVLVKFASNPELAKRLLATGDEELVEGNKRGDDFWGVSPPPPHGKGENWLGRILTGTRHALRQPNFSVDVDQLVQQIFAPENRKA